MAVKKFGTVTVNGVAFLGVQNFTFDADNGLTYRTFNTALGFPACAIKSEQTRTATFEVEDYDDAIALPYCGANVPVSVQLLGACGGANVTIAGTGRCSDLTLNESENGEIKTASFTVTFIDTVDGATEPVTIT